MGSFLDVYPPNQAEAAHYIERRLNRADAKNAQVEVRFQFYVPRTQHNASARSFGSENIQVLCCRTWYLLRGQPKVAL